MATRPGSGEQLNSANIPEAVGSPEKPESAALDEKTKEAYFTWLENHGINRLRDAVFLSGLDEDDDRRFTPTDVKAFFEDSTQAFAKSREYLDAKISPANLKALQKSIRNISPKDWFEHAKNIAKEFEQQTTVDIKGVTEEVYPQPDPAAPKPESGKTEKRILGPNSLVYTATVNSGRRTFLREFRFAESPQLVEALNVKFGPDNKPLPETVKTQKENRAKLDEAFKEMLAENQGELNVQTVRYDAQLETVVYWVDNLRFSESLDNINKNLQSLLSQPELIAQCLKYRKSFPEIKTSAEPAGEDYTMPGQRHPVNLASEQFIMKNKSELAEQKLAIDVLRQFRDITTEDLEFLQKHGQEVLDKYKEYKTLRAGKQFRRLTPEQKRECNQFIGVFERMGLAFGQPSLLEGALGQALENRFLGNQPPESPEGLRINVNKYFEVLKDGLGEILPEQLDVLSSGWSDWERRRLFGLVLEHLGRMEEFYRLYGTVEDLKDNGLSGAEELDIFRQAAASAMELAREKIKNPKFKDPPGHWSLQPEQVFSNPDLPDNNRLKPALMRLGKSNKYALKVPIQKEVGKEGGSKKTISFTFYLPLEPGVKIENQAQAVNVQNEVMEYFSETKGLNPFTKVGSNKENPAFTFQMQREGETFSENLTFEQICQTLGFSDRTLARLLLPNYLEHRQEFQTPGSPKKEISPGEKLAIKKFNTLIDHTAFPSVTGRLLAKIFARELAPLPGALGKPAAEPAVLNAEFVDDEAPNAELVAAFAIDKITDAELFERNAGIRVAHDFIIGKVRESFKDDIASQEEKDTIAEMVWKIKRRKIALALEAVKKGQKLIDQAK